MSRWKTWMVRLSCLGCMGTLAFGGLGFIGTIGTIGYGGYLLQQHWEHMLRAQLVDPTAGELNFDSIRLGLDSVTLKGVSLSTSSGDELLTVETLTAHGDPWSWTPEHITIRQASLDGVHFNLVRSGSEWATPAATLALFESGSSLKLPKTDISSLSLNRVSATLSSPEGRIEATVSHIDIPAVSATMAPGLVVEHGRVTAHKVALSVPDGESVLIEKLAADLPPLVPYLPELTVDNVEFEDIFATVPAQGWSLPGSLPAILHTSTGVELPPVSARHIRAQRVELAVAKSTARAQIHSVEVPELSLSRHQLNSLSLRLNAPRLSHDGPGTVHTDFIAATLPPIAAGSTLQLDHVQAGATSATVVKGASELGLPTDGRALLKLAGGGPTRIHQIQAPQVTAELIADSGVVHARVSSLTGRDLWLGERWSLGSASTGAVEISEAGQKVVTVSSADLGASGVLTVTDAVMAAGITAERTLLLPAIAMSHVPRWLGGTATTEWLGFNLSSLPWRPKELVVNRADIQLNDGAFVSPPVLWRLDVARFTLGPLNATTVPFRLETQVADGRVIATGNLNARASLRRLSIDARRLDLTAFNAYAAPMLNRFGISIRNGRVNADLSGDLLDSRLHLRGPTTAWDLSLLGHTAPGKVLARGRVDRVAVPIDLQGDLSDPSFSPIAEVSNGVVRGLTGQGGSLQAGGLSVDTTNLNASVKSKSDAANRAVNKTRDRASDVRDEAAKKARDMGQKLRGTFGR